MKNKRLINIYKLVTIVIIVLLLFLYFIITLKREEKVKNVYNNIEEDIYNFTRTVDSVIINSISFSKKTENITKEQRVDFAINYIILNISDYSKNIINLDKMFIYNENDSSFFSVGYIEKNIVEKIILDIFGVEEKIDENYKFLDKTTKYIALVPYFKEFASFEEVNLEKIYINEDNTFFVLNKYKRKLDSKTNEFNVKYIIEKCNNRYILKSYEILDSVIY